MEPMKTPTLLCLLALSSLAHAQAIAPPLAAPPVIVQQPPSYPGTTYAPAGSGLPTPGQPGYASPEAQRSPNKRVLPDEFSAKREAGVWAADDVEPPKAMSFVRRLYDVTIPAPKDSEGLAQATVSACLRSLATAADAVGLTVRIHAQPANARKCLAGGALLFCVERGWDAAKQSQPSEALTTQRLVLEHAQRLKAAYCAGVTLEDAQARLNAEVLAEWLRELKEGQTPAR